MARELVSNATVARRASLAGLVAEPVRTLHPACSTTGMATGIVAMACRPTGTPLLGRARAWRNVAAYAGLLMMLTLVGSLGAVASPFLRRKAEGGPA